MEFDTDGTRVSCTFDITGYGSGKILMDVGRARTLRDQLDAAIREVEE